MSSSRLSPIWYRLLKRPPFDVTFPSTTWRVLEPELASGRPDHWELKAHTPGAYWTISEYFRQLDWLEQALYVDGFCTRKATLGETIMEGARRKGFAERVTPPAEMPESGRGRPWIL